MFGNVVLIYDMDMYFKATKLIPNIKNYELFDIHNACGENTFVFSPNSDINLKDYNNIFILDNYLVEGYLSSISTKFNKIYTLNNKINMDMFKGIDVDRNAFAKNMLAIKAYKNATPMPDLITYFNNLKRHNFIDKNAKYNEFYFFMLVMEELGICKFQDGLVTISNIKSNLENSSIYNFVSQILKM